MHWLRKLISTSVNVAENRMIKLILNLPMKKNFCLTNINKNKKIYIIEEFKQCIHSYIKTYIDEHSVSSLVETNTMADDYAPTHKLIYLKNKRAGGVPNLNYV
jgi:TPP-dependent indolepyruvate ferredoxin oxidoreductase alpha subunit